MSHQKSGDYKETAAILFVISSKILFILYYII